MKEIAMLGFLEFVHRTDTHNFSELFKVVI